MPRWANDEDVANHNSAHESMASANWATVRRDRLGRRSKLTNDKTAPITATKPRGAIPVNPYASSRQYGFIRQNTASFGSKRLATTPWWRRSCRPGGSSTFAGHSMKPRGQ